MKTKLPKFPKGDMGGARPMFQVIVNDKVVRVYWTGWQVTMRDKPIEGLRVVQFSEVENAKQKN